MLYSYLNLNFDVLQAATGNSYADGNDISLVILGPTALFSSCKLTTNSENHLEDVTRAQIVSLLFKLLTSPKDTHALSIGIERDRNGRQRELKDIENIKGKNLVRIML